VATNISDALNTSGENTNKIAPQRDWSTAVNSKEPYPRLSTQKIPRIPPCTAGSLWQKTVKLI